MKLLSHEKYVAPKTLRSLQTGKEEPIT